MSPNTILQQPGKMGVSRHALFLACAMFALSLVLYFWTLAPVVTFVDSGELAAAVATNGVSHPSGSPLYSILGSVVKLLPGGTLIWKLNAFSAFCAALCVAITSHYLSLPAPVTIVAKDKRKEQGKKRKKNEVVPPVAVQAVPSSSGSLILASAGSLALLSNRALWGAATVTEVYALHALLLVLMAFLIALHCREVRKDPQTASLRYLAAAGVVAGLGASNYPPFGIVGPAVIAVLWRVEGPEFWSRWRRNLIVLAFLAAGLLPYIFLPLRAASDPLLNWGNPFNWENFWNHITAKQYSIFLGAPRLAVLPDALRLWWRQWPPAVWLLIVPGFFALRRLRPDAFVFSSVLGLTNIVYVLSYDIQDVSSAPSDYYVYLLPLCWCSALWIGAGAAWIAGLFQNHRLQTAAAVALALYPAVSLPLSWSEMDRSDYTYADDFARGILTSLAPRAFVLCPDWTFVSPAMYLQHGEHFREDVTVVDGELLRRTWYFPYLKKRSPDLYSLTEYEITAFLKEVEKYEKGLPYDGNVITEKYVAMLNGLLVNANASGHPAYILLNLQARESDPTSYRAMEQQLGRPPYMSSGVQANLIGGNFQWVPETPAFRLYADSLPHPLPEVAIPIRPIDPARTYDNVTRGVIDRYADFWRYRGDYLRTAGDCKSATDAYRKSLTIAPSAEAESGLATCQ